MQWPFWSRTDRNSSATKRYYGILVDTSGAILAVSHDRAAVIFLHECTPDSYYGSSLYLPYESEEMLSTVLSGEIIEWTWIQGGGFSRTAPHILTDELRLKAQLIDGKIRALGSCMLQINSAREKIWTGVLFQENVYALKKSQAVRFKEASYDDSIMGEIPFVVQYADFANIALKQAADEIIFKAALDEDYLAKTESLRLAYFDRIRKAKQISDLSTIPGDLMHVLYGAVI